MKKIKKLLSSKKGESLIESLISIIIFSLLIVTITLTIATALRITAQATGDAEEAQNRVNEIIAGNYPNSVNSVITFTFVNGNSTEAMPTAVSHQVQRTQDENPKAFWPTP